MASKAIEDGHLDGLNKLLAQSRLECIRTRQESVDSFETEMEEGMEEEKPEAIPEEVKEEETFPEEVEEATAEMPEIFPSPSLRKVLPDYIRTIEAQNRIHVLPETFRTDINPSEIPKIARTSQQKYIDTLAEMVGCKDYKSSMAEFWFLDTLANLLRRSQEDDLDRLTQAVLIIWFCEWMKEMQHFDAADRQRMLRRFKDNMLAAAKFVALEDHLPVPSEVDVHYQAADEPTEGSSAASRSTVPDSRQYVTFEGAAFECSLMDLTKIMHYIFDLFSTDYQYDLVRSVFTFSPDYLHIEAPYQLQNPKRLYAPTKVKAKKEKSPKKEKKTPSGKAKKIETEEFLALMELKAKEELELKEKEQRDREDYNLRSHILPLSYAATDELFDKYWPPPTPPEPEPEPIPSPVVKKVKKGKK